MDGISKYGLTQRIKNNIKFNFLQTSTICDLKIKLLSRLIPKNFVQGIVSSFLSPSSRMSSSELIIFLFGDLKIAWKVLI